MVYLRKASNDLLSHCQCDDGFISAPSQMDCPWCGCGWLFLCSGCGKAFTFADAVEVEFSLEEMALRDLQHRQPGGSQPSAEAVEGWVEFMTMFLRGARVGCRYVYFDSHIIPTDADGLTLEGVHSAHTLSVVPQVEALRDPSIIRDLLRNRHYWQETALPAEEEG